MRLLALVSLSCVALALAPDAQCFDSKLSTGAFQLGPIGQFGSSLAIAGDLALVGAPKESSVDVSAGSVYVFEHVAGSWIQTDVLRASDGFRGDEFGISVALHDGTAVIGAWNDDLGRGAVYLFTSEGGVFTETKKLTASDGEPGDLFGNAVAIDGDRVVVGARGDDDQGERSGAAYVFHHGPTDWVETTKFLAPSGFPFDEFGTSVSIYDNTVVVGADHEATPSRNIEAAYVFRRNPAGWKLQGTLLGSDPTVDHGFGTSVAVVMKKALVGAPRDDLAAPAAGAVHTFFREEGSWSPDGVLLPNDPLPFAAFGASVALSGSTALVGAPADYGSGVQSGAVYVFQRIPSGPAGPGPTWVQQAKLLPPDTEGFGDFGLSLAVDDDRAIIGAPAASSFGEGEIEGAYVSHLSGSGCPLLFGAPSSVSLSEGGLQGFAIQPGAEYDGHIHLLLGSASGIFPGTSVDGLAVPLNPGHYLRHTLQNPGAAPLWGGHGIIGREGVALASFVVPRETPAMLAGRSLHHAYVLIDTSIPQVVLVSNPVSVMLDP